MGETEERFEQAKGHIKEAAGDVTGNEQLEREGRRDRLAGSAKQKAERAKDKVEEGIDKIKDMLDTRDAGQRSS